MVRKSCLNAQTKNRFTEFSFGSVDPSAVTEDSISSEWIYEQRVEAGYSSVCPRITRICNKITSQQRIWHAVCVCAKAANQCDRIAALLRIQHVRCSCKHLTHVSLDLLKIKFITKHEIKKVFRRFCSSNLNLLLLQYIFLRFTIPLFYLHGLFIVSARTRNCSTIWLLS